MKLFLIINLIVSSIIWLKILILFKVGSMGEFAPEVQMQPPEVMQVTKRFHLPHLRSRQDSHQQPCYMVHVSQCSDVLHPDGRSVDDTQKEKSAGSKASAMDAL